MIIAVAILKEGDKAVEYFDMINPIEHTKTKEDVLRYQVEPYVLAGDVYGSSDLIGIGGWTWYTGSSGWFYKVGIEYILGLRVENGILKMKPCIPKSWKEYKIRYEYKSSVYNISVKRISNKETSEVQCFKVDGSVVDEKGLKLIDNGKIYEIEVEI